MKKIGIIGLGVVGDAIRFGFESVGWQCLVHDIKLNTAIQDVLDAEALYLCLPSPTLPDGKCDASIIENLVDELASLNYQGIVAIKSTVIPGTTQGLIDKHPELKLCFVPEFLRESFAKSDFLENNDILIVGSHDKEVFARICEHHKGISQQLACLNPTEAEYSKYFNNIFNATVLMIANHFYEMCQTHGENKVNYAKIKSAISKRRHISDSHLDCHENMRGFGGACLPKDVVALNAFQKNELNLNLDLLKAVLSDNKKFRASLKHDD